MLWTAGHAGLGPWAKVAALGCFRLVAHEGPTDRARGEQSSCFHARRVNGFGAPTTCIASAIPPWRLPSASIYGVYYLRDPHDPHEV